MTGPALDRLRMRVRRLGAPLCVGIDPHPDALPEPLTRDVRGVEAMARGLLEVAVETAAAVKVNVAFFEAFGSAGWAALERLRAETPGDLPFIADAKRGDIGTTAERYATAVFDHLGADGVTVSPYLGEDGVAPFVAHGERIIYVLARTSNPSAGTFQDLGTGGEPLHEAVASWVARTWPDPRVGLVVGATAPAELERLRALVPATPFLVPGVGAQGGDLVAAVRAAAGSGGPGIVNVSRAISAASSGADWQPAARRAAVELLGRMREAAGATLGASAP
ncbi:MAG TPA: orotidine-5'-phosphate decarboxylase [Candidatus Limnocylindria bacterium]|nr:orotidine-5'-phosphate decarboxylase [Candidatus Limnocylindria bacterium]